MINDKKENIESRQNELPLTAVHANEWQTQLIKMIENAKDGFSLDLGTQEDCDTAGIQLLWAANNSATAQGKTLTLLNPSDSVRTAASRLGIELNKSFHVME